MHIPRPRGHSVESLQNILHSTVHNKLVFLIFSGKNCYVCHKLRQHLPWFAETYRSQIEVFVIDARQHFKLATEHGIVSIPTIIVYRKGVKILREVGVGSKEKLKAILQEAAHPA